MRCKENYNKNAVYLAPIRMGLRVDIQNPVTKRWDKVGVVVAVGKRRDFCVKTVSGRIYWRNRRFLRPYRAAIPLKVAGQKLAVVEGTPELTSVGLGQLGARGAISDDPLPQPTNTSDPGDGVLRRSGRDRRPPQRLNILDHRSKSYDSG